MGTQSTPSALAPQPAPSAEPLAVALDLEIYDAPYGNNLIARVARGEVLELRPDHFVRVRTEKGDVTGYSVPPSRQVAPRRPRGLGLYVERETPLFEVEGGATIGTVYPGTFLPLLRFEGSMAEVELPPFEITARLSRSALAVTPPKGSPALRTYPRTIENRTLSIALRPGGKAITTSCKAPIGILEVSPLRVAQEVEGIEIVGTAAIGGVHSCDARTMEDNQAVVPPGFQKLAPLRITALAASRELFHVVPKVDESGFACKARSFVRRGDTAVLVEKFESDWDALGEALGHPKKAKFITTITYRLGRVPTVITRPMQFILDDSTSVTRDDRGNIDRTSGEGVGGDVATFTLLGETADGLVILDGLHERATAYHRDDARTWYFRRDACERALAEDRQAGYPKALSGGY